MKVIAEIWSLLDSRQRRQFVWLQVVAMLMAASVLATVAAVVPFFAVLGDPSLITDNARLDWLYHTFGFSSARTFLVTLGLAQIAIALLANAVNVIGTIAINRFAHRAGRGFGVALFDEYLHRDFEYHLATNSAGLHNNVIWGAERGGTGILQAFFALTTSAATVLLIFGTVFVLSPRIAIAAGLGVAAVYAVVYRVVRRRLIDNGLMQSRNLEARSLALNEAFTAIKEIVAARAQTPFKDRFASASNAIADLAVQIQTISQAPKQILETLVVALVIVVALVLGTPGDRPGPWLAQATFLGFAALRLLPALQQFFNSVVAIRTDRIALNELHADLSCALRGESIVAQTSTPLPFNDAIRLCDVSYVYAARESAVVNGIELTIRRHEIVGLVGTSGTGKTTLADLIAGILTPTSGYITVDEVKLETRNRLQWRDSVSIVPQRVALLDASIRENIALGTPVDRIDGARLECAARRAQLDSWIAHLPKGFDEIVGENGVRLSGGQRQRIGIARALYRATPLLILDEATNALDGATEGELLATLKALRGECTLILISHRDSILKICDAVVTVDSGGVVTRTNRRDLNELGRLREPHGSRSRATAEMR